MAYLPLANASTTFGHPREVLADATRRWGFEPNIMRALALRPEIMVAEDAWSKAVMYGGLLPRRLKEAVATTVSAVNRTEYCVASHAHQANLVGVPAPQVAACRTLTFEGFPPAERAALQFARKAAGDMRAMGPSDVAALRAFYSPAEIVELAAVVASFMMYNTFVTVLGLELEAEQKSAADAPS
ncbi:MAG: carboxymuconolactone decarboxylase family protein [Thermoplasmatota archaeon]